jgi:hypothetical protein
MIGSRIVDLNQRAKIRMRIALKKDIEFLGSLGLMDYSLLLAIENCSR